MYFERYVLVYWPQALVRFNCFKLNGKVYNSLQTLFNGKFGSKSIRIMPRSQQPNKLQITMFSEKSVAFVYEMRPCFHTVHFLCKRNCRNVVPFFFATAIFTIISCPPSFCDDFCFVCVRLVCCCCLFFFFFFSIQINETFQVSIRCVIRFVDSACICWHRSVIWPRNRIKAN